MSSFFHFLLNANHFNIPLLDPLPISLNFSGSQPRAFKLNAEFWVSPHSGQVNVINFPLDAC